MGLPAISQYVFTAKDSPLQNRCAASTSGSTGRARCQAQEHQKELGDNEAPLVSDELGLLLLLTPSKKWRVLVPTVYKWEFGYNNSQQNTTHPKTIAQDSNRFHILLVSLDDFRSLEDVSAN